MTIGSINYLFILYLFISVYSILTISSLIYLKFKNKNKPDILRDKCLKTHWFNNRFTGPVLIVFYSAIFGTTVQLVLSGSKLLFFLSSLLYTLTIYYIRNAKVNRIKYQKGLFANQYITSLMVISYILIFGICSFFQLSGFQLILFMASYISTIFIFMHPVFYYPEPEKPKDEKQSSSLTTGSSYLEKYPCFINSQDLSWLVRELNESMSGVIGFSELLLQREYTENEKEYMLRNIYQKALIMTHAVEKVSSMYPNSPTKPKEVHEIIDLLADENFK